MKSNWDPTPESFEKLLRWLNDDPEEAARKYLEIRVRVGYALTRYGCGDDAEHLTDVTIDRVMQKLEVGGIAQLFVGDKAVCFISFAKHVCQEHRRPRPPFPPLPPVDVDIVEAKSACLEECLRTLDEKKRWLVIEYYRFEKQQKIRHRKQLADELGTDVDALRLRVHRTRVQLKPCIQQCLERVPVY